MARYFRVTLDTTGPRFTWGRVRQVGAALRIPYTVDEEATIVDPVLTDTDGNTLVLSDDGSAFTGDVTGLAPGPATLTLRAIDTVDNESRPELDLRLLPTVAVPGGGVSVAPPIQRRERELFAGVAATRAPVHDAHPGLVRAASRERAWADGEVGAHEPDAALIALLLAI